MKSFGGNWTDIKLEKVRKYLNAYVQVLKNQPFKKIYIDAFAGAGYRESNDHKCHDAFHLLDQDELEESKDANVMKAGSAIEALRVKPSFDQYIFIEKEQENCTSLKNIIKSEFSELENKTKILQNDANQALKNICNNMDDYDRAVLFLDPFGMQVEWATIETIAKTHKIDMWYLFPSGIAVNRLLRNNAKISSAIEEQLNRLLGSHDWYEKFYEKQRKSTLFDEDGQESYEKIATLKDIKEYLIEKLKSIFPGVASNPLQLTNSKNVELYLLCFACSNKAGAPVALRIANYILQNF
jgi:three-Cys-motif partner protein